MRSTIPYILDVPDSVSIRVQHFAGFPMPSFSIQGKDLISLSLVADVFGYSQTHRPLSYVSDDHKYVVDRTIFRGFLPQHQPHGWLRTWVVDREGLSQIVARTRAPIALEFRDWASRNIFTHTDTSTPTVDPKQDACMMEGTAEGAVATLDEDTTGDGMTEELVGDELGGMTDAPEVATELVPFFGSGILAARYQDKIWVCLKRCCEDMGLDVVSQRKRLRRQPWATEVIMTSVAEDGKQRQMVFIDLKTLGMWVATIESSRCSEQARPLVIKYQLEAAEVLERHFFPQQAATGQSVDHRAMATIMGVAFREGTQQLIVPAVKDIVEPINVALQDVVVPALDKIEDRLKGLEEAARDKTLTISRDEIFNGSWMTIHDFADKHGYAIDQDQLLDWSFAMRNWWMRNRLAVEKKRYPSGREVCIYPEGALSFTCNFLCPRDVLVAPKAKTKQQEFPFRNGNAVR